MTVHRLAHALIVFSAASLSMLAQSAAPPPYKPARQVSGTVRICGSPQMEPLLELYERGFRERQPDVTLQNDLRSTLIAVEGVYAGHADIGALGREIWPVEREAFIAAMGHSPTLVPVATGAFDVPKATFALMIFVAKDNPLRALTLTQLARIFFNTGAPLRTWGELGLKGRWAQRPIHLYGFAVGNDKSMVFRDMVSANAEGWNAGLHEYTNDAEGGQDAGSKIIDAVAADPDGIGISNVHYANGAVKPLAIALREGAHPVAPTRASVQAHTYPLFRSVYAVVDQAPGKPLAPAVAEFLAFILSREGAQAVAQEGNYLPLTDREAKNALRDLQAP